MAQSFQTIGTPPSKKLDTDPSYESESSKTPVRVKTGFKGSSPKKGSKSDLAKHARLVRSKSVTLQTLTASTHWCNRVCGKPLVCPANVPLDLLFFRRIFSNLHRRCGSAEGEVPVAVFQRSVVRLFRILGMVGDFDADEYDADSSGAVGWYEFVTCWRKSKMSIVLSKAERVFLAMEDPGTCFIGYALSCFLMLLILLNCCCFIMATLPAYKDHKDDCPTCEPEVLKIFETLEAICVAIFSMEYGMRLVLSPFSRTELLDYEKILEYVTEHEEWNIPNRSERLFRFVMQPMNIIDLFAIAPFYLEIMLGLVVSNLTVLRVLRLTRLFRLIKLGRYFEVLQLVIRVFNKSLKVLNVLLMYLVLGVCFAAAIMFFLEGGDWDPDVREYVRTSHDGERSITPFKSIPHSFWWCIVTFTTVGYGDVVPVTTLGKLVAGCTMLCGILVLAMPISAISLNFGEVWSSWLEERRMESESRMLDVLSVTEALEGIESRQRLLLEVLDDQKGNDEFLGEVEFTNLPIDSLHEIEEEDRVMPLRANRDKKSTDRVTGSLVAGYTWRPRCNEGDSCGSPSSPSREKVQGALEVRIQRAEGLSGSDWKKGGLRDAYIAVHCWPKPPTGVPGEESIKPRTLVTRTLSDTLDPVWNEVLTFEFDWPRDWRPSQIGSSALFSRGPSRQLSSSSTRSRMKDTLSRSLSGQSASEGEIPCPLRSLDVLRVKETDCLDSEEDVVNRSTEEDMVNRRTSSKASEVAQLRSVVEAQGRDLEQMSSRMAEMHSIVQRLESLLRPLPGDAVPVAVSRGPLPGDAVPVAVSRETSAGWRNGSPSPSPPTVPGPESSVQSLSTVATTGSAPRQELFLPGSVCVDPEPPD